MSSPPAPGAHDLLGKIPGAVWKLRDHDPDLCRRDLLADHPWAWFVEIDGLIVDARRLPASVRGAAHRKGLIPDPAVLLEVDQ